MTIGLKVNHLHDKVQLELILEVLQLRKSLILQESVLAARNDFVRWHARIIELKRRVQSDVFDLKEQV